MGWSRMGLCLDFVLLELAEKGLQEGYSKVYDERQSYWMVVHRANRSVFLGFRFPCFSPMKLARLL